MTIMTSTACNSDHQTLFFRVPDTTPEARLQSDCNDPTKARLKGLHDKISIYYHKGALTGGAPSFRSRLAPTRL